MEIKIRVRKFIVAGKPVADPAPGQPLTKALAILKTTYPELVNSSYNNRMEADADVYEFTNSKVGTFA